MMPSDDGLGFAWGDLATQVISAGSAAYGAKQSAAVQKIQAQSAERLARIDAENQRRRAELEAMAAARSAPGGSTSWLKSPAVLIGGGILLLVVVVMIARRK